MSLYEKAGKGKDMILLHGNGEDHTIFEEAADVLRSCFTLYALDTRGHGRSSGSDNLHYMTFADDVKAFIDALSLDKPVILGFSDWAITALMLSYCCPDAVSAVVAAGANTEPDGLEDDAISEIQAEYNATHSALSALMLTEPHITADELKRISVPTLVIAGEHDMIKRSDTESIASAIPCSKLIMLQGENHSSYIHHSDKIARIVLRERPFLGIQA